MYFDYDEKGFIVFHEDDGVATFSESIMGRKAEIEFGKGINIDYF